MNALHRILLVLAVLCAAASGQNSSFETAPGGPVTNSPGESFGVAWGDIDGDDDPDLLVVDGNGPAANHLYRNGGDGTFTPVAGPVASSLGNSTDCSFADVDGDGDLDVFITNRSGSDNQLFINQGGSQAGTEGAYLEDVTSPLVSDGGDSTGMAWLDLEGDGDLDLYVTNSSGESNFLYTNQGGAQGGVEGSFVRVLSGVAVTDTGNSMDVVAADFDGNGTPDLYVANTAAQNNFLFYNDGAGNFTPVVGNVAPVNDAAPSQGVAAGDIDNDGDVDLVVANFLANNAVYMNMGGKQLGTEGTFQVWWAGPASLGDSPSLDVDLGDWDLDGNLDLIVVNCCGNGNLLSVGDGTGRFEPITNGPVVTDIGYSTAVAFADYDRDGGADLVVANRSTSGVNFEFLYHNRSPGTWVERTAGHPATAVLRAFDVAAADVDGDQDVDVFLATKEGDPKVLYVNQGGQQGGVEGVFAPRVDGPFATDLSSSFAATFGDIDADGDLDLAVANREGEKNRLYVNQGGAQGGAQGDFARLTSDPVNNDGGSSRDVRFADIDNDGDKDLFFANSSGESNFLYRNTGATQRNPTGVFQRDLKSVVATQGGTNYGADFGDVDSDGDADLFVASRDGENNRLYANQGGKQGGRLGEYLAVGGSPVVTMGGDSYAGTFGDMDNDGDLDLYVANNGVNFLYRNRGGAQDGTEGQFQNVVGDPSVADAHSSRRAEWGDIDADGDLDLFVPNTTSDNDLFRNRGDGRFALMASAIVSTDGGNSRGAAFADVDGDDDLDLLVANYEEPVALYLNKGPVGEALFTNLGKGLPGRLLPVLGGTGKLINKTPMRLQVVDAAPNSLAYLFVGSSVLDARLMGGTLVPAPDLLLGGLVTNSNGVLLLDGSWPGVPIGASVYFQVWITDASAPQGYAATNGLQAVGH